MTTTTTKIVSARPEHAPFVAWVMLTAARSHLPFGLWDIYIDRDEATTLKFLEALTLTKTLHWGHHTNFIVAEESGQPAAGLSGYFDAVYGLATLIAGVEEANATLGRTVEEHTAGMARIASYVHCVPDHVDGAWVVEWVGTAPEYRRRGLLDALMARILDIGRERGATVSEIGVLINNDAAQRAYEKNGFEVVQELRHPDFERVFGSPGLRELRRSI